MSRGLHRNHGAELARQNRRAVAMARPELLRPADGFARQAPASPISAPVKVTDPETRRLIDEALARRG